MLSVLTDFRSLSDRQEQSRKFESDAKSDDDNFWARVNAMDSKTMLSAISGSDMVSGDTITFKKNSGDTEQIFCNGRSTSCWIDSNGKMFSLQQTGDSKTPFNIQDPYDVMELPELVPVKLLYEGIAEGVTIKWGTDVSSTITGLPSSFFIIPSAKEARRRARMVWLLEPGTRI